RPRSEAPAIGAIAAVVHRLAIMLEAGTAPASAWAHAAESAGAPAIVVAVARRARSGESIPDALIAEVDAAEDAGDLSAWRGVAAAWMVAHRSGSPIGPALIALAESLRDVDQVH